VKIGGWKACLYALKKVYKSQNHDLIIKRGKLNMTLKDWWNNKHFIVKVGIIGSLIYILPCIYAIISLMFFGAMQTSNLWIYFVYFPAAFLLSLVITNLFLLFLVCIIGNIIIYFLVGFLIGWIIWKIKNRKNKSFKKKKS